MYLKLINKQRCYREVKCKVCLSKVMLFQIKPNDQIESLAPDHGDIFRPASYHLPLHQMLKSDNTFQKEGFTQALSRARYSSLHCHHLHAHSLLYKTISLANLVLLILFRVWSTSLSRWD